MIFRRCPNCRTTISLSSTFCKCGARGHKGDYGILIKAQGRQFKATLKGKSIADVQNIHERILDILKDGNLSEANFLATVRGGGAGYSFSHLVDGFIRDLESEGRSRSYVSNSLYRLKEMMQVWGDCPLESITPEMIKEFRLGLRDRGLTLATCDRYIAAGRAAWERGSELPNPFKKIKLYNPKTERTRYLHSGQMARLLCEAKKESVVLYEMLVVAAGTGLRKGNVVNLKRSEVDFKSKKLTVIQKRGGQVTLPIVKFVAQLLQRISDNGTDYFWINPKTLRPYTIWWVKPFNAARQRAGVPDDFTWHDLRHHYATVLYSVSGSQRLVKELLGHTQMSTSLRYTHVLPAKIFDYENRLERLILGDYQDGYHDDDNAQE
jgi:integrase